MHRPSFASAGVVERGGLRIKDPRVCHEAEVQVPIDDNEIEWRGGRDGGEYGYDEIRYSVAMSSIESAVVSSVRRDVFRNR